MAHSVPWSSARLSYFSELETVRKIRTRTLPPARFVVSVRSISQKPMAGPGIVLPSSAILGRLPLPRVKRACRSSPRRRSQGTVGVAQICGRARRCRDGRRVRRCLVAG